MQMLFRVVWIASALGLVGSLATFSKPESKAEAPAELIPFVSSDKAISLSYPKNWKPDSFSRQGIETTVKFEPSKHSRFVVSADLAGSLMADISRSGSNMLQGLPGMPGGNMQKRETPLESVHSADEKTFSKRYESYKEDSSKKARIYGQEAIYSDFTTQSASLMGSVSRKGRRITILLSEKRVSIYYLCTEEESSTLTPVFEKMTASLKLGPGGG